MTPPCHGCDLCLPTDEHGCCSRCAATYMEYDVYTEPLSLPAMPLTRTERILAHCDRLKRQCPECDLIDDLREEQEAHEETRRDSAARFDELHAQLSAITDAAGYRSSKRALWDELFRNVEAMALAMHKFTCAFIDAETELWDARSQIAALTAERDAAPSLQHEIRACGREPSEVRPAWLIRDLRAERDRLQAHITDIADDLLGLQVPGTSAIAMLDAIAREAHRWRIKALNAEALIDKLEATSAGAKGGE